GAYHEVPVTEDKFTRDGWLRTGDVATVDALGFMRITDRTKDLIKSGGEWISSVDLENALMAHPSIAEAAVIAIPDEKWSEGPCAARCVRWAEARAAPDPLLDGAHGAGLHDRGRTEGGEERARRRRRARQVPPARRHRGLRCDGAHGAGFLAALSARRWAGQL